MKIRIITGNIIDMNVDGIVVNLFEGTKSPSGATGAVDKAMDGAISRFISNKQIKGKLNETTIIHTLGRIAPSMIVVVGLGKKKDLSEEYYDVHPPSYVYSWYAEELKAFLEQNNVLQ